MHKLAIAALATATVGGAATVVVVAASRNDAHADTHTTVSRATAHPESAPPHASHGAHGGALCDVMEKLHGHKSAASRSPLAALTATADANDCSAVGEHLADLQADATHGPNSRPDETSFETCSSTYAAMCESEHWSEERRACTLGAGDLINAHLCAGHVATSEQPPAAVPANLTCSVLGPQIASTIQAAGMHDDVTDLGEQIAAACDVGNWTVELRTCFSTASTVDALKTCIGHEE
ncbi:MAG TPA: hypothetical protein VM692_13370 [Gammaproteobacteria bacterium]|nr:hypothetical protein [Gammaproteobacteria bacterium]